MFLYFKQSLLLLKFNFKKFYHQDIPLKHRFLKMFIVAKETTNFQKALLFYT